MGLVSKTTPERIVVPHEPGQWFEFRPPSYGQWLAAIKQDNNVGVLKSSITAWSYGGAVTDEAILDLDVKTTTWAVGVVMKLAGGKDEAQGNASAPGSKATT